MNTTLHQNRPEDTQNWTNLYLAPHDYRIHYVNVDCVISMEFRSLSRRRSFSRNVPSGEERILGDPGAVSRAGRKALRKFSSTGGRAPGYWLSQDHFQTVRRMLAPDWAQKMLCIIVPNRRTVSPEHLPFSWVRTRRLLSRHSCPVRSPSFPNQKRRNYRWVEKRFGCYQQEQFNLHWENSVSDGSQLYRK